MDGNMNIFVRQKGRQRGNNMLPTTQGGTGNRAERRRAERERMKEIKRQIKREQENTGAES